VLICAELGGLVAGSAIVARHDALGIGNFRGNRLLHRFEIGLEDLFRRETMTRAGGTHEHAQSISTQPIHNFYVNAPKTRQRLAASSNYQ
jgi:hypothetical protein